MSEKLSDERLAEIRARAAHRATWAKTNKPWHESLHEQIENDVDFLLNEVDRLRAENAALRGQVEKLIVYLDEAEQERDSLLGR